MRYKGGKYVKKAKKFMVSDTEVRMNWEKAMDLTQGCSPWSTLRRVGSLDLRPECSVRKWRWECAVFSEEGLKQGAAK